jgi:FSR family fosmidomycin resistance protein-like MFS transporter
LNFKLPSQPLLWGLLHGFNDFAAGFMLANFAYSKNYGDGVLFMVIYSIIGFGGQLPVGFWVDSKKQIQPFAVATLLLLPAAILTYFVDARAGIIVSGIASAFVHVTGGVICLQLNENKTGPLALFTAPGVLGLTLGGFLGYMNSNGLWIVLLGVVIIAVLIWKNKLPAYRVFSRKESQLDTHDFVMLGILLIMCFRSFIFDVINQVAFNFEYGVLILGISAFAGKIAGGFLADKMGWKKFVYISLPMALLCFQFGKENIYALAFGIACLQSSVPITFFLISQSLPLYPATATSLSFGTSIALAGLPLFLVNDRASILNRFGDKWISALILLLLLACWVLVARFLFKRKANSTG